ERDLPEPHGRTRGRHVGAGVAGPAYGAVPVRRAHAGTAGPDPTRAAAGRRAASSLRKERPQERDPERATRAWGSSAYTAKARRITGCATFRTGTPPGVIPHSVPRWACPCSTRSQPAVSTASASR